MVSHETIALRPYRTPDYTAQILATSAGSLPAKGAGRQRGSP